jgi:glycerol-3-phosphate dehydrogenase
MNKHFDAIIIGAGIQGAGCAQALAARGYSVLVVEKATVGSGTSSRSSKLIHGGLRYLESGQFSLVKKSLRERALLQQLAPTLVKKKAFILPVYRKQRLKPWQLYMGLSLYALLGKLKPDARFRKLPNREWPALSGLKQQGLLAVYQYYDAQTDDLALTQAVMRSAQTFNCELREHCEFNQASKNADGNWQVSLFQLPQETPQAFTVSCKLLINAAGPWAELVQQQIIGAPSAPPLALVKGSHIELDLALSDSIYYLESPIDQRAIFIMPWQGHTLVGSTEKLHSSSPESQQPSLDEIEYLYQSVQHYFPDCKANIINQWSGLRVLPNHTNTTGKRPFSGRQRDTIIAADDAKSPQLISLYGGKLTAYRITANEVAKMSERRLGVTGKAVDTATLALD